jgi:hypothetical protein
MSDKDDQIEVEVDDPVVSEKEQEIKVVTDDEGAVDNNPPIISAEDGIKELRRRLEAEHNARLEAEHYAKYAREQASRAYEEVGETQFHLVSNALDTVKRDGDFLKAQLRDAMNIGDHDRAAEIQEAMSANAIRLNQLEVGKRDMETRPRQPAFNPPPPPPPRPVHQDPLEQIAQAVSPRSASWIRANKDSLGNERALREMFRAHESAVDHGYAPDSDAYFQFVENRMGISDNNSSRQQSSSAPIQRKASPPAAPVSRSGNGTGSRPNVVRLSSEQQEMAKNLGMTNAEYAAQVVALRKEGKLTH